MFRSGQFVAAHVEPLAEDAVQPNGVDLTLDAVFDQTGPGRIGRDGKTVGDRTAVDPDESGDVPTYHLDPGGYVVRYGEVVQVPDGHVGFLLPRSSLLRNACTVNTAVWDAGYEGRGEGLLQVHHPIDLEAGARVAQIVFATGAHTDTYDGSYQGENR
ncbi:MAG: deoxyuridine 5'-triphosphate nucleotidohydrolase [Halobacteriaceae archaeon]